MGGSSKSKSVQNYADNTKNISLQGNTSSPIFDLKVSHMDDGAKANFNVVDPGSVEMAKELSVRALDLAESAEEGAGSVVGESMQFAQTASDHALDFASNYTPQDDDLTKYLIVGTIGVILVIGVVAISGGKHA